MPWRGLGDGTLYRLDSHLFYQRIDGKCGMVFPNQPQGEQRIHQHRADKASKERDLR